MSDLPNIFNHDKTYFLRLSEDMIGICEDAPDPKCAGAILCVFEYWMRVKLAHRSQALIENAIAVKHGEEPVQDTGLWVWKTAEELITETLGLFGIKKLRENREWLVEQGFLHTRENPKYGWDRTIQYHLDIERIRIAISMWPNGHMHVAESPHQYGETATAIPETTTETTTKTNGQMNSDT